MLREKKTSPSFEDLAIQGLMFLLTRPENLGEFLAEAGIGPEDLRASAKEPAFLQAVLTYICADEPLLMAFSAHIGQSAAQVDQERAKSEAISEDFGA